MMTKPGVNSSSAARLKKNYSKDKLFCLTAAD